MILAIDPGTDESSIVGLECRDGLRLRLAIAMPNIALVRWLRKPSDFYIGLDVSPSDVLVIEQIAAMGMAVGGEVLETCVWSGRFIEAWDNHNPRWNRLKRIPIKIHLCGQARAKDANVRQALIDRFGGPQSTKKGGPLYKVHSHCWAALAVAVTYYDLHVAAPARAFDVLQETRE